MIAFILLSLALSVESLDKPGEIFNLDRFKLQIPLTSNSEVSQAALKTHTGPFLYTDPADGGMVFWCPANGITTSGSKYPRTELREVKDWTFSGKHTMTVDMTVLQVPDSGKIAIGQIKAEGSASCSIVEELIWESGKIVAHQRGQEDPKTGVCGDQKREMGTYSLGERFTFKLQVSGNVVTVTVGKEKHTHAYTWFGAGSKELYFKTGAYVQQEGQKAGGGRVKIHCLNVYHG